MELLVHNYELTDALQTGVQRAQALAPEPPAAGDEACV